MQQRKESDPLGQPELHLEMQGALLSLPFFVASSPRAPGAWRLVLSKRKFCLLFVLVSVFLSLPASLRSDARPARARRGVAAGRTGAPRSPDRANHVRFLLVTFECWLCIHVFVLLLARLALWYLCLFSMCSHCFGAAVHPACFAAASLSSCRRMRLLRLLRCECHLVGACAHDRPVCLLTARSSISCSRTTRRCNRRPPRKSRCVRWPRWQRSLCDACFAAIALFVQLVCHLAPVSCGKRSVCRPSMPLPAT